MKHLTLAKLNRIIKDTFISMLVARAAKKIARRRSAK